MVGEFGEHLRQRLPGILARGDGDQFRMRMIRQQLHQHFAGITGSTDDGDFFNFHFWLRFIGHRLEIVHQSCPFCKCRVLAIPYNSEVSSAIQTRKGGTTHARRASPERISADFAIADTPGRNAPTILPAHVRDNFPEHKRRRDKQTWHNQKSPAPDQFACLHHTFQSKANGVMSFRQFRAEFLPPNRSAVRMASMSRPRHPTLPDQWKPIVHYFSISLCINKKPRRIDPAGF